MKLCFIVNDAAYFALHWLDRACAAKKAGYDVHLLCRQGDEFVMRQLHQAGIHWHEISLKGPSANPFNLIKSGLQISRWLRRLKPDLVHCITLKPCLIGAGLAGRWPVVLTFPGLGRLWSGTFPFARPARAITGWWWRRATRKPQSLLVFEHEGDRKTLVDTCCITISRTMVTGCSGVNPDAFAYSAFPRNRVPVVLFAGRLIRPKGLDTLLNICRQLRSEGVALHLQVAGLAAPGDVNGIPEAELVQLHHQGEIEWLGARHDMPALIAQANIIALPSRYAEGVPRILLEAASCGRPSVAFDRGGCRTILPADNSCGALIKDGDDIAFAAALRRLLQDPACCERKGKAGRQRVLHSLTASHAAAKNLSCYKRVLSLPAISGVMELEK